MNDDIFGFTKFLCFIGIHKYRRRAFHCCTRCGKQDWYHWGGIGSSWRRVGSGEKLKSTNTPPSSVKPVGVRKPREWVKPPPPPPPPRPPVRSREAPVGPDTMWHDGDPIVSLMERDIVVRAVAFSADLKGMSREKALEIMVIELSKNNTVLMSNIKSALRYAPLVIIKDTNDK